MARAHAARLALACAWFITPVAFGQADAPPDLSGRWEGAIETPGARLQIDVDFKQQPDGAWSADISIPAQGAADLPLSDVRVHGRAVAFKIPNVPGDPAFKGKLAEDGGAISGEFTQAGATMPFKLSRKAAAAATAREKLAGLDDFMAAALKDWVTPGAAVGVVVGDQVVLARGFGFRDIENKKPVTGKTLFAIGSSTKAFTTFVMGSLADEGKLDWDAPVRTYLPGFRMFDPVATEGMTPRDLVTHRSGLPRHDLVWYNSTLTLADMVARLPYLENSAGFREKWQYNNLMFGAAGHLIEVVSGRSWEQNVRERVFAPLGMTRSNFSVNDAQKDDDHALPYEEKDDALRPIAFRDIANVGPAGSINSCVDDMTRWLMVHLGDGRMGDKQVIDRNTLRTLHTPQMELGAPSEESDVVPGGYALGWFTDVYRGHARVYHGGNIDGFSALVSLVPRDRIGVVVLVNESGAGVNGIINRWIMDRLLDLEPRDWNAEALVKRKAALSAAKDAEKNKEAVRIGGTKPSHALDDYAGEYEHSGYGVAGIERDGERLVMTFNRIRTPFEHWHYDVFNGTRVEQDHTFENFKIKFDNNFDGDVDALEAAFEPTLKPIRFTRRPDRRLTDPKYLERFVGAYELAGQTVTVALKPASAVGGGAAAGRSTPGETAGGILTVYVPGQPVYELTPDRADRFRLKELTGYSLRFISNGDGVVNEAQFNQPNGVYTAKRKPSP